jgi:hypothetical protein
METRKYPCTEQTIVELKSHGNLQIMGIDGNEIVLSADSNTLKVERSGDRLDVVCFSDCNLQVPPTAKLTVDKVGGDVFVQNLKTQFTIHRVGGNFAGQELASFLLEKVGGNVLLQHVDGLADLGKVGGDMRGDGILELHLMKAGGDLQASVQKIAGSIQAGGDLQLKLTEIGSDGSSIRAGGDIALWVDPTIALNLLVESRGEEIRIHVGEQVAELRENTFQVILGEGGPVLKLDAGGAVVVTDTPDDEFEPMDDFEIDFSSMKQQVDRINEHAARISELANRRVEESMRHAEKRIQHAMRNMERRMPGFTGIPPMPERPAVPAQPASSAGASANITNDERMAVLKMLQEKKITLEQAEKLLAVLEGRS